MPRPHHLPCSHSMQPAGQPPPVPHTPFRSRFPTASRAVVRSPYPEWMGACLVFMRRNLTARAPRVRGLAHPRSRDNRLASTGPPMGGGGRTRYDRDGNSTEGPIMADAVNGASGAAVGRRDSLEGRLGGLADVGKLVLRLTTGGLMLFHGVDKLIHGLGHIRSDLAAAGLPAA